MVVVAETVVVEVVAEHTTRNKQWILLILFAIDISRVICESSVKLAFRNPTPIEIIPENDINMFRSCTNLQP